MRNRGLTVALWIIAVFSAVGAILSVRLLDASTIVGQTSVVEVVQSPDGAPAAAVYGVVERLAQDSRTTVVREIVDVEDPGLRHLYLALGSADADEARWLDDGYPAFSRDVRTEVHPVDELQDVLPAGRYAILGTSLSAGDLADAFVRLGYDDLATSGSPGLTTLAAVMSQGPLGVSAACVALLVVILVATSVVAETTRAAVLRLHGVAMPIRLLSDLRRALPAWAASTVTVTGVSAALLATRTGLSQWPTVALVAGSLALGLVTVAAVAHVAASWMVSRVSILDGLRGRLPGRDAALAVYVVRGPVLVLATLSVVSVVSGTADVLASSAARDTWSGVGTSVTVRFGSTAPAADMDRNFTEAGAWLRERDSAGDLVLAIPLTLATTQQPAMIVNTTYLRKHPVTAASGTLVSDAPGPSVRALVPSESLPQGDAILADVRTVVEEHGSPTEAGRNPSTDVEMVPVRSGEQRFTYAPDLGPGALPAFLRDPVLIVVDPATEVISADDYGSYASQGRAVLTSLEAARGTVPPRLAREFVDGYSPVAQDAAVEHALLIGEVRLTATNATLAVVVLVMTSLALGQVSTRSRAPEILVGHLHGWPPTQTHRGLLSAEAALAGALAAWTFVSWVSSRPGPAGSAPAQTSAAVSTVAVPVAAVAILALGAVSLLWSVAAQTRRLTRTRTVEEL